VTELVSQFDEMTEGERKGFPNTQRGYRCRDPKVALCTSCLSRFVWWLDNHEELATCLCVVEESPEWNWTRYDSEA